MPRGEDLSGGQGHDARAGVRQSVLTPVNTGVADGRAELPSLFPAEIIADD
jgi:hypothetical protein